MNSIVDSKILVRFLDSRNMVYQRISGISISVQPGFSCP